MDYVSVDDLRDELGNYASSDTGDDIKMQASISAACRQIDNWCGQRFWQDSTATARTFMPYDSNVLDLADYGEGIATTDDLVIALDVNDVGSYGTTLTTGTDYILRPTNAASLTPARPYTELYLTGTNYLFSRSAYGRDLVQITAKWGWPAVPDDVVKAALIQSIDLFKSKDAAFGVAGSNEFGLLRVQSGINRIARALLEPYRKPTVA